MHANFDQLEQYTTGKIARRHALDFLHADESISMIDNESGVLRAYDLPPEQSLIYASESVSLAEAADEYAAATEFENTVLQNVPTFQLLYVLVDELVSAGITRFAQYLFLWQKRYLPGPEILATRFGDDYWQQLADTANLLYGPGTIIKTRRSSFKNAPVDKLLKLVHDETERIQARGITDYDARYDRTRSVRSSMLLQRLPGGMEELRQLYRERFHAMVFMAADTRPGKRLTIPNKHTETNFSKWYLTACANVNPKQSRAIRADTIRPHLPATQRAMMIERFGITMQRLGLVNRPLQSLYEEKRDRFEPAAERLMRWLQMTWNELLEAAGLPTLAAVVEHESLVASFEQQSQSLKPTLYEFQWRNPQI
jgi:hypothetical protein